MWRKLCVGDQLGHNAPWARHRVLAGLERQPQLDSGSVSIGVWILCHQSKLLEHLGLFRAELSVRGARDGRRADLRIAALQKVKHQQVKGRPQRGHLQQLARRMHWEDVVAQIREAGQPAVVVALQHQRGWEQLRARTRGFCSSAHKHGQLAVHVLQHQRMRQSRQQLCGVFAAVVTHKEAAGLLAVKSPARVHFEAQLHTRQLDGANDGVIAWLRRAAAPHSDMAEIVQPHQ
mmetsp:Transcript_23585/g.60560  ORF Transcript_23585/g.60560 Transcript_23585/m.60560 type:complete len:233 (-) Transcript_23585:6218-6916(-)